jgi:catalase
VDHALDGAPSVLFDAVALLPSAGGAAELAQRKSAKDFVSDAFAHHKFIGVGASADVLLAAAGVEPDDGVVTISDARDADAFLDVCGAIRIWGRDVRP